MLKQASRTLSGLLVRMVTLTIERSLPMIFDEIICILISGNARKLAAGR